MTFLGLPYPWVFCLLKKLVLYTFIICRDLSDSTRPGTLKNLQVAVYERPRPPLVGGSAEMRHNTCGLGGDKCLLKRVKDMLDVEELRVPRCISYPLLKHAQVSRIKGART